MKCVLRLVLIFALSFGAVIAPDVSSASISDLAMTQMDAAKNADRSCGDCDPTGSVDGIPCESGCPVPCGSSGLAGILIRVPTERLAMPFGIIVPVGKALIPLGTDPSLDPFPPKLPV